MNLIRLERIWIKKRSIGSIFKIRYKHCWKKLISCVVCMIKKLVNCKLWLLVIQHQKIVNISKMSFHRQFVIFVLNMIN
ncbi:unnamed protein product, partial [Onchocerca flexuosa]|uniref:Uncharacterized protein n=1 Tax=Onchocerca flexuosa TaxID=387005 RepID=A0A183HSS1_9BILA